LKIFEVRENGVPTRREYHPETQKDRERLREMHPALGNCAHVVVAIPPPKVTPPWRPARPLYVCGRFWREVIQP
jgi:hypothetical protein